MPARKQPAVVILTEDDLRAMFAEVQKGFAAINERLDALEDRISKPGLPTAKLRAKLAADAVKAVTTRPAPTKQVARRGNAS